MNAANLGCGNDYREGMLNVDIDPGVEPDRIVDLDARPWPFARDEFGLVLMDNVLEHLDDTKASIEELARVVEPNGVALVSGPHPNSRGAWVDPTHSRPFHPDTFDHYLVGDLFEVLDVDVHKVRFGRVLPDMAAMFAADHIGHIVSGFTITLRRTEVPV